MLLSLTLPSVYMAIHALGSRSSSLHRLLPCLNPVHCANKFADTVSDYYFGTGASLEVTVELNCSFFYLRKIAAQ